MKTEILDLSIVMTSFHTGKSPFKYMLHLQHDAETPYYIHLNKQDVMKMFKKFRFSETIISDFDLRYRVYKPI